MGILLFLASRLKEGSTYAAIGTALALLHLNVDPGLMHTVSLFGALVSVVLGIVIADQGKPVGTVVSDVLGALAKGSQNTAALVVGGLLALSLAACDTASPGSPGSPATFALKPIQMNLAQVQGYATLLDKDIHAFADPALASGLVPPAAQGDVTLALASMDAAVTALNGAQGAGNQVDPRELAKAVLTAVDQVVQLIPTIPSSVKTGVDIGTGLIVFFVNDMPVTVPAAAPTVAPTAPAGVSAMAMIIR